MRDKYPDPLWLLLAASGVKGLLNDIYKKKEHFSEFFKSQNAKGAT